MRCAGLTALAAGAVIWGLGATLAASAQSPVPQSKSDTPAPPAKEGFPFSLPSIFNSSRPPADSVSAFDDTQRALADRVSGYLSGVQQLVGDFVQVGPDG